METNKKVDVGFIWQVTDSVLRDTFKKNEIGDVVLPFVVIRRLDSILEPVNTVVRETYDKFYEKLSAEKLDPILRKAAGGLKFYNTSRHTLQSLKDDPRNIDVNFNNYLNGFSSEVKTILENFQFDKIVARLIKNHLLYQMVDAASSLDLGLTKFDNHGMGYVFEELIRISNEQSNETAGEHFTPRDVIALMSEIMFTPDKAQLNKSGIIRTIFDPACGTGGMVNLGKKFILDTLCKEGGKPEIITFGQELNEQSYAIAKSEALITGSDSSNIRHGNSFSNDQFEGKKFHYIMANPPYGVSWKRDQVFITKESLNPEGRFTAGTPRSSDGQLLFIQHMLSKMEADGSRIGVVTNGSPLFTGGAGSGESDIRKWIIENDWLECIVALPKDLFYNTGINTFIWFLTNKKSAERRGKIQLINAVEFCKPAPKSLGNKRNNIEQEHISKILDIYTAFEEGDNSKIFKNEYFGFYSLTVEQPLRGENGELILKKGTKQADSKKRDTENMPLGSDVMRIFTEEVLPHIDPESWLDISKTRIGYEVNFTKYFYKYTALRPSSEIKEEIKDSEKGLSAMINELFN